MPREREKETVEEAGEFKYGVKDLADMMDLGEFTVRNKLRNAGVKKAGRSYGWNSRKDLEKLADELSSESSARKDKDEDEPKSAKRRGKRREAAAEEEPKGKRARAKVGGRKKAA